MTDDEAKARHSLTVCVNNGWEPADLFGCRCKLMDHVCKKIAVNFPFTYYQIKEVFG